MTRIRQVDIPAIPRTETGDKVIVPHGSEFFHETAGSKDKTLKLYEGHYHDLLADTGKETVMADFKKWLGAHLPK